MKFLVLNCKLVRKRCRIKNRGGFQFFVVCYTSKLEVIEFKYGNINQSLLSLEIGEKVSLEYLLLSSLYY
jgi:hypothetical protein